jgi:hypothetical protein
MGIISEAETIDSSSCYVVADTAPDQVLATPVALLDRFEERIESIHFTMS